MWLCTKVVSLYDYYYPTPLLEAHNCLPLRAERPANKEGLRDPGRLAPSPRTSTTTPSCAFAGVCVYLEQVKDSL
jgi:hypothetical protein